MPDEYISRRDARIAILEKQAGGGLDQKITVGSAEAVINAVPAADVAPVVRCKDCKYGYYASKPNGAMVCLRTNDGFWRKEADFCRYGEYQTNTGGVTE